VTEIGFAVPIISDLEIPCFCESFEASIVGFFYFVGEAAGGKLF
jgi:hypothetical protein